MGLRTAYGATVAALAKLEKVDSLDMTNQPLVSIITPTYNHERFIKQCIESVLAQSYPYWEQIIIDDGSTDKTGEIAAQYSDKRIKYIRQSNAGIWKLGKTYNKALQVSHGELIAVLEGDDFWPPYKLERQVFAFDKKEVVLSWGRVGIVDVEGKLVGVNCKSLKWFKNRPRGEVIKKLFLGNFIYSPTAMCRKDTLLAIGGFNQPEYAPYVDYPTWMKLSLVGEFQPVDEVLGYWRRHHGQVSTNLALELSQAGECSISLFNQMPQELRDLTGLSMKQLAASKRQRASLGHVHLGRISLIEGKWQEAWEEFRKALDKSPLSTRLKALLGLMCSYCKVDMEWAAGIMHRPRYR